jgi:hypothetical protein
VKRALVAVIACLLVAAAVSADTYISNVTATPNGDRIESLSYAAELGDDGGYAWGTVEGWHCLDSSYCVHFYVFHEPYSGYFNVLADPGCHTARLSWFFISITGQGGMNLEQTATGCLAGTPPPVRYHLSIWVNVDGNFYQGDGSGDQNAGTTVVVSTGAPSGYQFHGWSGDVTSSDRSMQVYMNSDKTVTAWWTSPPPPPPGSDPINNYDDSYCPPYENCHSPIIVNLGRGGYELSGPGDPVKFDIMATGKPIRIGWTARGAAMAFVTLDRNGNGMIDDGSELFGNYSRLASGALARNGFDALRQFDENHDSIIDARDPIWLSLLLWTDLNHDGVSQPSEISLLRESRLTAIDLRYHWSGRRDAAGNTFRFESLVWGKNSAERDTARAVYDVFLVAAPFTANGN